MIYLDQYLEIEHTGLITQRVKLHKILTVAFQFCSHVGIFFLKVIYSLRTWRIYINIENVFISSDIILKVVTKVTTDKVFIFRNNLKHLNLFYIYFGAELDITMMCSIKNFPLAGLGVSLLLLHLSKKAQT